MIVCELHSPYSFYRFINRTRKQFRDLSYDVRVTVDVSIRHSSSNHEIAKTAVPGTVYKYVTILRRRIFPLVPFSGQIFWETSTELFLDSTEGELPPCAGGHAACSFDARARRARVFRLRFDFGKCPSRARAPIGKRRQKRAAARCL